MFEQFHIIEMCRTGITALARGGMPPEEDEEP